MDDQLQLDRQLTDFFAEAKSVSLSATESETLRFAMETFLMEKSVSPSPATRLQEYMTHGREASGFNDHFLGDKEKRQLRKNLVSFMQQNPRVAPREVIEEAVESFSLFRMFEIAVPRLALGLLLFVGLGAGVSFASQSTVPGDFLYPFKVAVYEPIVSKLTTDEKSQAAWEAQRLENRLKEAEQLSASSKLTKENAAELRVRFNSHLNAAQKNIEALNAKGKADVALSIQTGLETYLDSHSTAVRDISLEEDAQVTVDADAAVAAKKIPAAAMKDVVPPANANSLVQKVQTILSLPAAASSSASSEASSAASLGSGEEASSSSKEHGGASKSSKKEEPESSSSHGNKEKSSAAQASSAAEQESSSLVSDLFDDIMDAASSATTLPDLLPKL